MVDELGSNQSCELDYHGVRKQGYFIGMSLL